MFPRLALIVLLLLAAAQTRAAFDDSGGLQGLVDDADVIAVGMVDQVVGRRVDNTAETVSTVTIETVVKGAPSPIVSVLTDGGVTPTVVAFVEDEAELTAGTRTVLFLEGPDGDGKFRVASGAVGSKNVVNGQVPSRGGESLADLLAEIEVLCGPSCP